MANIMITTFCNLRCSYCFAEECRGANFKGASMSISDFRKALDFVTKTDNRVSIIGGEPTTHPEFAELLKIALADTRLEVVFLFTNGVNLEPFRELMCVDKLKILFNLNSPKNIGEERYARIIKNISYLKDNHPSFGNISFGYNLYEADPDLHFLLDTLQSFNKHDLRLSVVVPNSEEKRSLKPLAYFEEMKPAFIKLMSRLKYYDVVPRLDCNFIPICVFSENEKRWLSESFAPISQRHNDSFNILENPKCDGPIDILPDLQMVRCFGLSEHDKLKMADYKNLYEVVNYFKKEVTLIASTVSSDPSCSNCKEFKNLNCDGGCLSYKINKINKVRAYVKNIETGEI